MAQSSADRSSFFPAIEKKHGLPMSYWHDQMKTIAELKYLEQIAFLRENHGFSQAHANALVLYSRGNTTSKRFNTIDEFLRPLDKTEAATIRKIIKAVSVKYPKLEWVIAWNQPMLKQGTKYAFGISASKMHILLMPLGDDVLKVFESRLGDYGVLKKTIQVPLDWKVDAKLLTDLVKFRLDELKNA